MNHYNVDLAYIHDTGFGGYARTTSVWLIEQLRQAGIDSGLVAELGCGSGIIGIAAAAAMGCRVTARDVDPEAVTVTRLNSRRNGVASLIDAARSRRLPSFRPRQRYDLVLANILAEPLVRLASYLPGTLTWGGHAVLAGILEQQGQQVLRAYLSRGLRLKRRTVLNGWLTLVLSRERTGGGR